MSQQDVEIVERVMAGLGGGPSADADALTHPEVEYDARVRPGGRIWHGPEGVQKAMREWTAGWEAWTLDFEQFLDAGDGRVVMLWRERGRAKGSGAEMSQEGATVVTVRDGLVVSVVVDVDRRGTLAALGLSRQAAAGSEPSDHPSSA